MNLLPQRLYCSRACSALRVRPAESEGRKGSLPLAADICSNSFSQVVCEKFGKAGNCESPQIGASSRIEAKLSLAILFARKTWPKLLATACIRLCHVQIIFAPTKSLPLRTGAARQAGTTQRHHKQSQT